MPSHATSSSDTPQNGPKLGAASVGHTLPQLPQLLVSVPRSTQVPLQSWSELAQPHVPFVQTPVPSHTVVFGAAGFEHWPEVGSHVPATWHWSLAVQTTGAPPQAPPVHWSAVVQALPSLQVVPSGAEGLLHCPVEGVQVPATWHGSLARHVTAETPVSTHTAEPVVQDTVPVSQRLPGGVHAVPAVHAAQWPALHTWPLPQDVPSGRSTSAPQVGVPVEHDVVPVWQGLPGGVQEVPETQATHCPALHTSFVPQGVPSEAGEPVSVHAKPDEHDTVPTSHGLPAGVQVAPGVHEEHAPFVQ